MGKRSANRQEVLDDINSLEEALTVQGDKERLKRLGEAAISGVSMKWWLRRFLFGFSLSDAIEKWLKAFNPSLDKPIGDQIPVEESRSVVAAWVRLSMLRAFILALIALVPVGFLYWQIKKQDELIQVQVAAERNKNLFLYVQSLYDSSCEEVHNNDEDEVSYRTKTVRKCQPRYNFRQRSAAALGYIELVGEKADLSYAHLSSTKLGGQNFEGVNLFRARLAEADLQHATFDLSDLTLSDLSEAELGHASFREANLRGADLTEANLNNAVFWGSKLTRAKLREADLFKADFRGADLSYADLRETSLGGAKFQNTMLTSANLHEASLIGVSGLDCSQLQRALHWQTAYRGEELACGQPIPRKNDEDVDD